MAAIGEPTPETFLRLDDSALLAIGFSRQKARYVRGLASAVLAGSLDLDDVARLDDERARTTLTALPGIGPWTADIYLLLALGRPDIWPTGDLALVSAVREVKRLAHRPSAAELTALAEPWRPWRAAAARLFWHDYLSRRGQRDPGPELLDGEDSAVKDPADDGASA
jgi:DNA-3-methyladenine glycosylase II